MTACNAIDAAEQVSQEQYVAALQVEGGSDLAAAALTFNLAVCRAARSLDPIDQERCDDARSEYLAVRDAQRCG